MPPNRPIGHLDWDDLSRRVRIREVVVPVSAITASGSATISGTRGFAIGAAPVSRSGFAFQERDWVIAHPLLIADRFVADIEVAIVGVAGVAEVARIDATLPAGGQGCCSNGTGELLT